MSKERLEDLLEKVTLIAALRVTVDALTQIRDHSSPSSDLAAKALQTIQPIDSATIALHPTKDD